MLMSSSLLSRRAMADQVQSDMLSTASLLQEAASQRAAPEGAKNLPKKACPLSQPSSRQVFSTAQETGSADRATPAQ